MNQRNGFSLPTFSLPMELWKSVFPAFGGAGRFVFLNFLPLVVQSSIICTAKDGDLNYDIE